MKTTILTSVLFLFVSCTTKDKDDSVVLARVGNQVLTVKKLEILLPAKDRADISIKNFVSDWVDGELMFQAAANRGLLNEQRLLDSRDQYYKKIVVGALLETASSMTGDVSNDDVRSYYDSFSSGFVRHENEALIHLFKAIRLSDAKKITSILRKKNKKSSKEKIDELFSTFDVEIKTVTKGQLIKELDLPIFKTNKLGVVGPIKTGVGFHVVDVIDRYKKGSQRGLESVYDEIYQRIIKQKRVGVFTSLLDSLKEETNVFINSNYR